MGPGVRTIQWHLSQLQPRSSFADDELLQILLDLGEWLHQRDYRGPELASSAPHHQLSTSLAFSLAGWLNLHRLLGESRYLERAGYCLTRILEAQTSAGTWLFPYPFRNNPADFPYSCENLMTLRALLSYATTVGETQEIAISIRAGLDFMEQEIGFEHGIVWYSSADHIIVPNVSSLAANVYARAARLFSEGPLLDRAREFAGSCVDAQAGSGAHPYFGGEEMVYMPYHALETWELIEANEILADPRIIQSTDRAIAYSSDFLSHYGYASTNRNPSASSMRLFKTPVWVARSYALHGNRDLAQAHLSNAWRQYNRPGREMAFYTIRQLALGPLKLSLPDFAAVFTRYNASFFEVGTNLLLGRLEPSHA